MQTLYLFLYNLHVVSLSDFTMISLPFCEHYVTCFVQDLKVIYM